MNMFSALDRFHWVEYVLAQWEYRRAG